MAGKRRDSTRVCGAAVGRARAKLPPGYGETRATKACLYRVVPILLTPRWPPPFETWLPIGRHHYGGGIRNSRLNRWYNPQMPHRRSLRRGYRARGSPIVSACGVARFQASSNAATISRMVRGLS